MILEIPRRDHSRRIPRGTRVGILLRVKNKRIRVLEHIEISSHGIAIHNFMTRSGPFILGNMWQRSAIEESPDKEHVHRCLKFIRKSGTPVMSESYTLKLQTLKPR